MGHSLGSQSYCCDAVWNAVSREAGEPQREQQGPATAPLALLVVVEFLTKMPRAQLALEVTVLPFYWHPLLSKTQ